MAAAATASAIRISATGAHRLSSRSLLSLRSFAPKQHRPLPSFSKRGIQTCTSLYRTPDTITKKEGQPKPKIAESSSLILSAKRYTLDKSYELKDRQYFRSKANPERRICGYLNC